MINTGLGYEDGSSIAAFAELPDAESTDLLDALDFLPLVYDGRDSDGQVVFAWQYGIRRLIELVWSGAASSFVDTLEDYVAQRRLRIYPDVDITATYYRVRVTLYEKQQSGERYFIRLNLEQF